MEKMCSKCHEIKHLGEFHYDSTKPDGHGTVCKMCKLERLKLRRQGLRERTRRELPRVESKTCGRCGETVPVADFYRVLTNHDGYSNWCKACTRERSRAYHKKLTSRRPNEMPHIKAKRCPVCGGEKPVSEFYEAAGKLDGYRTVCKECESSNSAERRKKIADRDFEQIRPSGAKTCSLCGQSLPVDQFNYCRSNADGLTSCCRECGKKYKQQHYAENCADFYRRTAQYRSDYPDRRRAFQIVHEAIRNGELTRPAVCSKCAKSGDIIAHHSDYGMPLDVMWLCLSCDRQLHADLRKSRTPRQ